MSSDALKPSFKSVEVKIFNQVYSLRTSRDVEHIKQVAGLVDERMRLISAHATAHDLAKIAIFAALNIADELSDTREHYERELQKLLTLSMNEGEEAGEIGEGEGSTETLTLDSQKSEERQSWFEDIFDSPDTPKSRSERLSSRVSAKLQSLRQSKQEAPLTIEEDN